MPPPTASPAPPRRLRPEKREAIVTAARTEFGRVGFVRAGTEAIAARAGVSTRTVYKHFASKDELFRTVLVEGAEQVADTFLAAVRRLDGADSAEDVVAALGRALVDHRIDFPDHFAISQYVSAEREQLPAAVLDEWRRVGPLRVEREVARLLRGLAGRGALDIDDVEVAAFQLILLTAGAAAFLMPPNAPVDRRQADRIARDGSRTFLRGTLPRR